MAVVLYNNPGPKTVIATYPYKKPQKMSSIYLHSTRKTQETTTLIEESAVAIHVIQSIFDEQIDSRSDFS